MNSDIFIPARLDSKRLPKKHLKKINNEPLIKLFINRMKKSTKIRHVVVCTTDEKSDDELVEFLKKENILFFRGSKKDIIARFLDCAEYFHTDIIIDVEGDKIFTDIKFVDMIIKELESTDLEFITGSSSKKKFDAFSNIHGFIPAGIKVSALHKIFQLKKTTDTETGYKEFFTSNKIIKKKFVTIDNIDIPKKSRFTIDYLEDYEFAKVVFSKLGNYFDTKQVIELIKKQPELLKKLENVTEQWNKNYKKNKTNLNLSNNKQI